VAERVISGLSDHSYEIALAIFGACSVFSLLLAASV
jgi:hypothetical protein